MSPDDHHKIGFAMGVLQGLESGFKVGSHQRMAIQKAYSQLREVSENGIAEVDSEIKYKSAQLRNLERSVQDLKHTK
jgi:hypothetical protein